jgi:RNA polymerase sigma-70 factor (ECF subfamily)
VGVSSAQEHQDELAQSSDERLVLSVAQGDQDALGELIKRHAGRVGATVLRIGRLTLSTSDVEEAVADTFVAAWRRASTYDPKRGPVIAWLLHIAHYRALDIRRRVARHARDQQLDAQLDPDVALSANVADESQTHPLLGEQLPDLERSLGRLSAADLQLLHERFVDGRSPREIAQRAGISPNAVRVRLSRALSRLRRGFPQAAPAAEDDKDAGEPPGA